MGVKFATVRPALRSGRLTAGFLGALVHLPEQHVGCEYQSENIERTVRKYTEQDNTGQKYIFVRSVDGVDVVEGSICSITAGSLALWLSASNVEKYEQRSAMCRYMQQTLHISLI